MEYKNIIRSSVVTSILLASNLSANDKVALDTVTVTAQKSEEDAQKVPISLSVFDEISMGDKSISNLKDVAKYTPGLMLFHEGQEGVTTPSIRGISASSINPHSPVGMYIDGAPVLNNAGFADPLMDIERIEVLKGPQGTLYGKNTEAGVINIITRKPNNETRGKVYTKAGNDGKLEYGLSVSGPIIKDKFYAGISYKHNEKDGFIKHDTTGEEVNYKESDYGKINLRFTPTDNLDISLVASKNKNDNGAHDMASPGQNLDDVSINSNLKGSSTPTTETFSLSVDYDIDNDTKIKSITTKRVHDDYAEFDFDFSPLTMRHIYRDEEFDTTSQEFRLEKNIDKAKLVTGIYLDKEDNYSYLKYLSPLDPTGATSQAKDLESKTLGVFGNIIYPIDEKWTVNGGIRYDKEEKDLTISDANIYIEEDWSNVSPKLSLQYNLNKDSMAYTTIAKGYRSGGFNPYTTGKQTFDEESLISYEIGYKSMLLDNKIKFNSAIYYMDIDDMQVLEIAPLTNQYYTVNAAKGTSKGIELDLEALLSDEITLFSSVGFNKTTFDEFVNNEGDHSGNYNTFAPKYNFNIGAQYRNEKGYYARADINGYGKTYFDNTNTYYQKAYTLVNTKIGYERDDFDLYLYADNLFDKEHHATNTLADTVTVYNPGREIGIQLNYRF